MKLAVVSDIHGNIAALDAVVADIARRGVASVVNLGDSLSGPFDAVATAERLIALGWPAVQGNHDRALWDRPRAAMGLWEAWIADDLAPRHIDWLRSVPATREISGVFLCHGTPASDEENWLDERGPAQRLVARDLAEVEARLAGLPHPVLCCGHTHEPRAVRLPSGQLVVNPGSVGCPGYLDTRMEPNFVQQTGSPDARYAILERTGNNWQVDLVSVPYDSSAMARLARSRCAESWARAVETGWIT